MYGFFSDSCIYYNYIDKYIDICYVIIIDLLGYGEDQFLMDEMWNFDYIMMLLDWILDKYKDKLIILFGYLMGGCVVLYYVINGYIFIFNLILESMLLGIKEEVN